MKVEGSIAERRVYWLLGVSATFVEEAGRAETAGSYGKSGFREAAGFGEAAGCKEAGVERNGWDGCNQVASMKRPAGTMETPDSTKKPPPTRQPGSMTLPGLMEFGSAAPAGANLGLRGRFANSAARKSSASRSRSTTASPAVSSAWSGGVGDAPCWRAHSVSAAIPRFRAPQSHSGSHRVESS